MSTPPPANEATTKTTSASSVVTAAPVLPAGSKQIDLAFCCDCTGSMGSYIKSAQDNIRSIATGISEKAQGRAAIRFALVKYRDHPPQDSTYVTEVFPFTSNLDVMKMNIDTMAAQGGGDGPEAVSAALHEVNELGWNPNATKICVLISDAPPHGLGENGDGFPDGCPLGTDPLATAKSMAGKGIVIYAVGVEPILSSSYKFARDFMMTLAQMTEGRFLPLGRASVLTDVVVSGTIEGLNMKETWDKLEADVQAEAAKKGEKITTEELVERVKHRVTEEAPQMMQVEVENPYMKNYDMTNCRRLAEAPTLKAAKKELKTDCNVNVQQQVQAYQWSAQTASACVAPSTAMQHERMVKCAAKSKGIHKW